MCVCVCVCVGGGGVIYFKRFDEGLFKREMEEAGLNRERGEGLVIFPPKARELCTLIRAQIGRVKVVPLT